ncbi:MFS transporter [Dactylosporangium sp. CA-233914]|uniref:MFS transporter n=1 Tax=Dactylosporangium sp. CA-233914 TaxID=3239934 RepID=UPI003D911675
MSAPTETGIPLSWQQQRLWFLHQLQPNATDYHIALARRLHGPLDVAALHTALTHLTAQQDILRTRYPATDGVPHQVVDPPGPVPLEHTDLSDLSADRREPAARRLLVSRIETPFDLARTAPVRWLLLRLAPDEHVLCLILHHIAGDGWSLGVLCDELTEAYRAARSRGEPPPRPAVQYADYALRQRDSEPEQAQLGYWRARLADVTPLDLQPGRERPPVRTGRGAVLRHTLPRELCEAVAGLARGHRVTLFMTVLAAYQSVLARHSGSADVCVGTPVSLRDSEELEPLVGCFVNTLLLRGDLSGAPGMAELLRRTRDATLGAYDHADLPFDRLVRDLDLPVDLSRTPVYQAMFRLDPAGDTVLTLDGLTIWPFELQHRTAQTDLTLEVTWGVDGGAAWADFVYDPAVLTESTVEAIAKHLTELLAAGCADPHAPLPGLSDRLRATPVPRPSTVDIARPREAPQGPVETALVKLWAEVLQAGPVAATDDFFHLGGHSLLAIRLVARMRSVLPPGTRPISVIDVFQQRTIRRIVQLATGEAPAHSGELLHELTPPGVAGRRAMTLVCVPYGGGSAVVYQPLAEALGTDCALYAVAIPGHDPGVPADPLPLDEVARRCVAQIQCDITGPVVLYGHCGVGGALTVEIALQLQQAGREPEAVYLGATYPFARPPGRVLGALARLAGRERLRSGKILANWLTSMGADLGGLDREQIEFIVRNIRRDGEAAERFYSTRLAEHRTPLRCPVISVVGERDPVTEYAQERYREWHALGVRTALVVLPEAGHFFLKYRAAELAQIVTGTHTALAVGTLRADPTPHARWWVAGISDAPDGATGVRPSMVRFVSVAAGQLVSIAGSAITDFAIPLWVYLRVGSLTQYAILAVLAIMPGVLAAPLAGVVVDRGDRRRVMLGADLLAGGAVGTVALLYATGTLHLGFVYVLVAWLSIALTFQRLAYASAVPQLVPKRYLGHANGLVEMSTGLAQFLAPLLAVALVAVVGLGGVLAVDLATFAVAVGTVLAIRFPAAMAYQRRESLGAEMLGGLRHVAARPHVRAMLGYFAGQTVFLSALMLAINPLVLSFADLSQVAAVAVCGGIGAALGGLAMTVWGGPVHRRMRVVVLGTVVQGAFGVLTGLRPSVALVAVGLAGMLGMLAIIRGTYGTIVHTKVPQRLQGRVFAVNQMISWSTIPLGFAVLTPLWAHVFEPMLRPEGALAGSLGLLVGTGPGRGIGLMYVVFGLVMAVSSMVCLRVGRVARFDDEVPDTEPDDLLGLTGHHTREAAR